MKKDEQLNVRCPLEFKKRLKIRAEEQGYNTYASWVLDACKEKFNASEVEEDLKLKRAKADLLETRRKYQAALEEIRTLRAEGELREILAASASLSNLKSERSDKSKPEAVAASILSDCHVGEVVSFEETNGLNEHNPEIAEKRINNYFLRLKESVELDRQQYYIPRLILCLGGDLINNYLREEDLETNSLSPTEELIFAQRLIIGGIKSLLEDREFEEITIVCCDGNHGRFPLQRKIKSSARQSNSLENLLYQGIAERFRGEDERLEFVIRDSLHTYLEVHGEVWRFHHGDKLRGGKGAYFAGNLSRQVENLSRTIYADLDIVGHWHQLNFLPNVITNGSTVGTNAFSIECGFQHQLPQQAYWVSEKNKGVSVTRRLFVD